MGANALVEIESIMAELPNIIDNKMYEARQDAWLSACEWIISLKGNEKVDCKKAFEKYISSLTS
jgi:hypothetical protein